MNKHRQAIVAKLIKEGFSPAAAQAHYVRNYKPTKPTQPTARTLRAINQIENNK